MEGIPETPHIWLDLARAAILSVPAYVLYLLDRRKRQAEIKRQATEDRSQEEAIEKSKQDRLEGSLDRVWLLHGRVEEVCAERDRLRQQLVEAQREIQRLKGNGKGN